MPARVSGTRYSARARLLAAFLVVASILGGGGTPNPLTELLLQIVFVPFAVAWVWLGPLDNADRLRDRWAVILMVVPVVIPVVQLVPLPPSVWTSLPGRGNEVAALSLIGEQSSWRPLSLSPSRTLASLLAILPAVFCFYAVARLDLTERRLVLWVVLIMALMTAWLGALQLVARGEGFNFYPQHSVGWVTGFQANRNATADVLLIGLLALGALASSSLVGTRKNLPLGLTRRTLAILVTGLGLVLLAAVVMTGSRAGIALILIAFAALTLIFLAARNVSAVPRTTFLLLLVGIIVVGVAAFAGLYQNAAIVRVTERFSDLHSTRTDVWEDSWFALKQYWPVGFGMGGFEPAMFPAEQLEYLDPLVPNRAHNDFLEIGIEAGILGYVAVSTAVATVIVLASRAWREPSMRGDIVFGLSSLLLIALHSVVDYPLRSMAVACLSGVAGGLVVREFSAKKRPGASSAPKT